VLFSTVLSDYAIPALNLTHWLRFRQDGTTILFYGVPSTPGRPAGLQPTIATSAPDGTSRARQ